MTVPHFSLLISANARMEFQTEMLIKSLETFGECTDYFFDVSIPENEIIKSRYIKNKVNVNTYKPADNSFIYPWVKNQQRYNIKPKSDICIFLDADILFASKVQSILDYCANPGFYACIANEPPFLPSESPFFLNEWRKVFSHFGMNLPDRMYTYKNCCVDHLQSKEKSVCPFYPNLGFAVVHSGYVEKIKNKAIEVIEELSNTALKQTYYLPQVANAIALQLLKIPTHLLPNEFNYMMGYNYKTPLLLVNDPVVYHYNNKVAKVDDLKYRSGVYGLQKHHDKAHELAKKLWETTC
jgi:hypothetical protein